MLVWCNQICAEGLNTPLSLCNVMITNMSVLSMWVACLPLSLNNISSMGGLPASRMSGCHLSVTEAGSNLRVIDCVKVPTLFCVIKGGEDPVSKLRVIDCLTVPTLFCVIKAGIHMLLRLTSSLCHWHWKQAQSDGLHKGFSLIYLIREGEEGPGTHNMLSVFMNSWKMVNAQICIHLRLASGLVTTSFLTGQNEVKMR